MATGLVISPDCVVRAPRDLRDHAVADVVRAPVVGVVRPSNSTLVRVRGGILRPSLPVVVSSSQSIVRGPTEVQRVPQLPRGVSWRLSNEALEALLSPPTSTNVRQEASFDPSETYVLQPADSAVKFVHADGDSLDERRGVNIELTADPRVSLSHWRVAKGEAEGFFTIELAHSTGKNLAVAGISKVAVVDRVSEKRADREPESLEWRVTSRSSPGVFAVESRQFPGRFLSAEGDGLTLESGAEADGAGWRIVGKADLPERPPLLQGGGSAPSRLPASTPGEGDWDWIRTNNGEIARSSRREISALTRQATAAGGYVLEGRLVQLGCVEAMCSGTRILAPSRRNVAAAPARFPETLVRTSPNGVVALQAAAELAKEHSDGRGVAVTSAASAYHCGGGFLTGGRHALEEAICVQTTLHASISQARLSALRAARAGDGESSEEAHFAYIPQDGVILSPRAELFREGTARGYSFLDRPVELAAVISLAMFNQNPKVGDAPLDAPEDEESYEQAVADKFRSAFAACAAADATALVVPDVGCGVYMNDAQVVGRVFGEVLRRECWGQLREVVLCGKREFQEAVRKAVEDAAEAQSEEGELKAGGYASDLREELERRRKQEEKEQRRIEEAKRERQKAQEELERRRQEEAERKAVRDAEELRRRQQEERQRAEQDRKEEEARQRREREAARRREEEAKRAKEAEERRARQREEAEREQARRVGLASSASRSPSPQPQTLQIVVPAGVAPGQQLQVLAPDGQQLLVMVPPGVHPGSLLQVQYVPQNQQAPASQVAGAGVGLMEPVWEYSVANGRWKEFQAEHQPQLEEAYQAYVRGGGQPQTSVTSGTMLIRVNFVEMKQSVLGSDRKRDVRRREQAV